MAQLRFSDYDKRNYPTLDVRDGYARWAPLYDQHVSKEMDLVLLERLATVRWQGAAVVELACGTGRIGAWLMERGVRAVVGVDGSAEMLARAGQRNLYAELLLEDVRATSLASGSAGVVVNVLCACHLPALEPLYAEAARLVSPGGSLVVCDYHWHFLLNGIPTHFPDETGQQIAIENHVHLFGDHVRAARRVGFELRELEERVVDEAWGARAEAWRKHIGKPVSFALVWERASG